MSLRVNRRQWLGALGGACGWLLTRPAARAAKVAVRRVFASSGAPKGYDPTKHHWQMCIDLARCIGCGLCVEACKTENHVPQAPTFFRTWIERYVIRKAAPGSGDTRGATLVDSPNGGRDGFPPLLVPREEILHSFFVPKLCNECRDSPCVQACPVGATFDSPDGVVLVDPTYCIGCGFCVEACPYGCRYLNPETHTADKCTLCYHRITRGLKPACVEVCPGHARIFGDLLHPVENDPIQAFVAKHCVDTLKTYLGTNPQVLYADMDKEVR